MIHLIITTANISDHYEERKASYIDSIERALKFDYLFDSYTVLECASSHEDYLDSYQVHYSKIRNVYPEKGLNEMQHIKTFVEQAGYKSEDTIIKLTGRYILEDSSFFNKIKLLETEYDSVFKNDIDQYEGFGYHTFLYAAKKYRLLKIIESLNFSMENRDPIEWGVKNYLEDKERHYEIARLGIKAYQGAFGEKVFIS